MSNKYGKWTVLSQNKIFDKSKVYLKCRCECGTERNVLIKNLKSGISRGCGCVRSAKTAERNTKHGKRFSKLWPIWQSMKARCYNEKRRQYKDYGGRGIRVYEPWINDFQAFYDYMGEPPNGLSIDRIDNNGNYEPGNLRWATAKEQNLNRRSNRLINGVHISKIDKSLGSKNGLVYKRLKRGWDLDKAITTPLIERLKVEKIEPSVYEGEVCNIEVKDDNSYVTEGFIVHNCKPSASKDIIFDRETLEKMVPSEPVKVIADFKIFKQYDPSHRYGSGHDVAGGVGLDSSTSVFIDFDVIPAKVVATFKSNTIKPDTFGDEIYREGEYFSHPITAPEKNNHGHATIARLKQLGANLYKTQTDPTKVNTSTATEYGWHTNSLTKPKMIFALVKAVNDGLIDLSDADLIQECKSYTRNDLIDTEKDPRLTTRHFDLLIAAAIAWQMNPFAEVSKPKFDDFVDDYQPMYSEIGI